MNHDEEVYPEPFAFKPERFFDENGKLNENSRILSYGFGRRQVCVFIQKDFTLMIVQLQNLRWKSGRKFTRKQTL